MPGRPIEHGLITSTDASRNGLSVGDPHLTPGHANNDTCLSSHFSPRIYTAYIGRRGRSSNKSPPRSFLLLLRSGKSSNDPWAPLASAVSIEAHQLYTPQLVMCRDTSTGMPTTNQPPNHWPTLGVRLFYFLSRSHFLAPYGQPNNRAAFSAGPALGPIGKCQTE
jgi:hypothetical protein